MEVVVQFSSLGNSCDLAVYSHVLFLSQYLFQLQTSLSFIDNGHSR